MSKSIYIVYRIYTKEERPNMDDRSVFYGWSPSKDTIKAFLKQRNRKKYAYKKFDKDSDIMHKIFPEIEDGTFANLIIDYIKLKFASTKEEVCFFTTNSEMREAEAKIQKKFHNLTSLEDRTALQIFMNLDPYYLDALELLGFKPKEVDYIYDSADNVNNYNTLDLVEQEINLAYEDVDNIPSDELHRYMNPPGLLTLSNIADKILYSMDNFINVLREDL